MRTGKAATELENSLDRPQNERGNFRDTVLEFKHVAFWCLTINDGICSQQNEPIKLAASFFRTQN